jgi:hypothetical protein
MSRSQAKPKARIDLEQYRSTFLLLGVISALSIAWFAIEWRTKDHNPRQFILVGIPMHIENLKFRNELTLLDNHAREVGFSEAQQELIPFRGNSAFFENQRLAYIRFRLDTAAMVHQIQCYNLSDHQYLRMVSTLLHKRHPANVSLPRFMQKSWFILPWFVPENVPR